MKTIMTSNDMSPSNNRCGGGKSSISNNHQRMASSSSANLSTQGETQAFMYMPLKNNDETFQHTHLDQNKIQVFILVIYLFLHFIDIVEF